MRSARSPRGAANATATCLSETGMTAGLFHSVANPLSQSSMPLAGLGRGDLERDGEELLVVTRGPAAQHGKDLSCVGYGLRTTH